MADGHNPTAVPDTYLSSFAQFLSILDKSQQNNRQYRLQGSDKKSARYN